MPSSRFLIFSVLAILFLLGGSMEAASVNAAMPPQITHVFTIMMENHDWSQIKGSPQAPYFNSLLSRPDAAYASNYHNLDPALGSLHPSEPAYVWLEAATTIFPDHTFVGDQHPSPVNSTSSTSHLTTLLDQHHLTWKSYQEDISGKVCPLTYIGHYAPKHNPMIYFHDVTSNNNPKSTYCISHNRPFTELSDDLSRGVVPNYAFITPNLLHDMHDGSIAQADSWLKTNLPTILDSSVYKTSGAIFITWDEGRGSNNPIGMIILSPFSKGHGYTNVGLYDHSSYVKTIEQIFNLSPLLGHAADQSVRSLEDFFTVLTPSIKPTTQPKPTITPLTTHQQARLFKTSILTTVMVVLVVLSVSIVALVEFRKSQVKAKE